MRIFASDEADNADLCLKMGCIEYMRNFFNDHMFRVNTYSHLVPAVVKMGSTMMQKCVANSEAINEILDMYRFVVDKYACMTLPMGADMDQNTTVNDFLVSMLQEAWTHFLGVIT